MRHAPAVALAILVISSAPAIAAPHAITVFVQRAGQTVTTDDGDEVAIPAFGGSRRTWRAMMACVTRDFSPFAVDITDRRPAGGTYITAIVGGRASQLGMDDETVDGVGPYSGEVIPEAVVHTFSQIAGEDDPAALCAATAHEIGHALGLDHEKLCGDLMSYDNDACGTERFVDKAAPCGEDEAARTCGDDEPRQNSYRRLVEKVGRRGAPVFDDEPSEDDTDTGNSDDTNTDADNEPVSFFSRASSSRSSASGPRRWASDPGSGSRPRRR